MRRLLHSLGAALLASSLLAVACSSSPEPPSADGGSCAELASRCHPVSTPLGKECHELGHAGDEARCGPRSAECLAECPVGYDAGAHATHDAGPTDAEADGDAGATPCATYCACMSTTCSDQPGYPFADEAACLAACADFTAEHLACQTDACEDAKIAIDKAHDCEHASGLVACH